jgi:hypothetical protein
MRVAGIPLGVGQNVTIPVSVFNASFNTDFSDSTGRHIPTTYGSPIISNSIYAEGGGSLSLPGGTNFVRCSGATASDDFIFLENFSIKCKARFNTLSSLQCVFFANTANDSEGFDGSYKVFMLTASTAGIVEVRSLSGSVVLSGGSVVINAWHDFELKREGSTVSLVVNDVTVDTMTNSSQWGRGQIYIGGSMATIHMDGYIDSFEVYNG